MSGLFGGHKAKSTSTAPVASLNVQTSIYGSVVPLVYGQNRLSPNLIHYLNFVATPHTGKTSSGGKGGGGGSTSTTSYTYSVACAMAIGIGPGTSVGTVWVDKDVHTLSDEGLTLFTGANGQSPWSYLTTNAPSQAVPYSNIMYVASGALQLGSSPSLPNYNFEVTGLLPYNAGTINDAEPAAIITDYLTHARHGVGYAYLGSLAVLQTYCRARSLFLSPIENNQRAAAVFLAEMAILCNSGWVNLTTGLALIPFGDTAITGNGVTYTPNLTPQYDLGYDDFQFVDGGDPVQHTRTPDSQSYNSLRVEFNDRAYQYNTNVVEARDPADIDANGLRIANSFQATAITSATLAMDVARLMMQRQLFVRNYYTFTLGIKYSLLEPMVDFVTITDPGLGLNRQLVRILSVEEQDDALTLFTEEVLVGTANSPAHPTQPGLGYTNNFNADPGSTIAPLMMNAPGLLTVTGYETWVAACGDSGHAGVWGGCQVWVSDDNVEYRKVGAMLAPARYGTIVTAALPAGSNYDTTNTLHLALNPTQSSQMIAGTQMDVDQWRALLFVGGEWVAYKNCALVASATYDLTSLGRAGYGSLSASHAIGAPVAVIDEGIFRLPYDKGNVGNTVYFKFPAFNIYGGALQSLASATAYTHVLGASDATAPSRPVGSVSINLSIVSGAVVVDCSLGTKFYLLLTANVTSLTVVNCPIGFGFDVQITQDATGGRTFVPGSNVAYAALPAYVPSTGAGAVDLIKLDTFNAGAQLKLSVISKSPSSLSATYSPMPFTKILHWTSGANLTPSQVITVTTAGAVGAVTHSWSRSDSGTDASLLFSSTTSGSPTVSAPHASRGDGWDNIWTDHITDAGGNSLDLVVVMHLEVTNNF